MKFKKIREAYSQFKNHGFCYGFLYCFCYFFPSLKYKCRLKALNILENKYKNFLNIQRKVTGNLYFDSNEIKCFYIFWAQGKKNMPKIVDLCISQIKNFYPDYNIVFLDLSNFSKYVEIKSRYINMLKKGTITIQTFSDILRFNLLSQRGGIWCDATLLFFGKIDIINNVLKNGLYSLNFDSDIKQKIWGKVYDVTYATYFLASNKGNIVMKSCAMLYDMYYDEYDYAIDYFMNDYFLILCSKYKLGNSELSKIEKIDSNPYILSKALLYGEKINLSEINMCPQKMDWRTFDYNKFDYLLNKKS